MKTYQFVLLLISFILIPFQEFAQTTVCDSVQNRFAKKIIDTTHLKKLTEFIQLQITIDCKDAICLSNIGIEKSKRLKNSDFELQFKALLGYSYKTKGDYKLAVATFIEALKQADQLKNSTRAAFLANNLGTVYLEIGKFKEAERYFEQAIQNGKLRNDQLQLARTYVNYGYLKDELKQYDSSLYYYNLALPIFKKQKDRIRLADLYLNMGRSELSLNKGTKSLENFQKSLFAYQISNDIDGQCRARLNIAEVHALSSNHSEALSENLKALDLAKKMGSDYLIDYCYQVISDNYEALNQPDKALTFFKMHDALNDSINTVEKDAEIQRLEEQYQSEKKDKKILENQQVIQQQKNKFLFLQIIVIAAIIIIGIIFFLLRKLKAKNSQLFGLIKDKEFLIGEVHHRVKNNLQLLSSLLELQIRSQEDEKIINLLTDSQNRVLTIANIHTKLYSQSNVEAVEANKYITDLCVELSKVYTTKPLKIDLNIDKTELPVDQTLLIGLILNELITNSLKHAFSKVETPEIHIELINSFGTTILRYFDNGTLNEFDFEKLSKKSLGLKVIRSLSKQLKGDLEVKIEHGLKYTLKFVL
jgi:two-component sensor histidine kinase